MGQFWIGIFIIAVAAALGWWGTQVASEGWKNWKRPVPLSERAMVDPNRSEIKSPKPDPIIRSYLEHPVIAGESPPRINKTNPEAILLNDGAVSAVSVRVDLWSLSFQKDQVAFAGGYGRSPHGHLFSVEELGPGQQLKEPIPGISGSAIAVYIFDMTYHRKDDLKAYERREMFFTENGVIYTASEFESREDYKTLTAAIKKFMNEKNTMPKTIFRGTDQHAWIADPDPRHDIALNKDGSASLRLRFPDMDQLKRHYRTIDRPYLQLTPAKFKDSNSYLKAKFSQNMGTVNYLIEVTNEGNVPASNVRQDIPTRLQASPTSGTLPSTETVSIAPSGKKFLKQEVLLRRVPSASMATTTDAASAAEINFEQSPLLVKTTLHYSLEKDTQSRYRTTVTYELRENTVKFIGAEYE